MSPTIAGLLATYVVGCIYSTYCFHRDVPEAGAAAIMIMLVLGPIVFATSLFREQT